MLRSGRVLWLESTCVLAAKSKEISARLEEEHVLLLLLLSSHSDFRLASA